MTSTNIFEKGGRCYPMDEAVSRTCRDGAPVILFSCQARGRASLLIPASLYSTQTTSIKHIVRLRRAISPPFIELIQSYPVAYSHQFVAKEERPFISFPFVRDHHFVVRETHQARDHAAVASLRGWLTYVCLHVLNIMCRDGLHCVACAGTSAGRPRIFNRIILFSRYAR